MLKMARLGGKVVSHSQLKMARCWPWAHLQFFVTLAPDEQAGPYGQHD